jgi:hypothetical protein
MRPDRKTLNLWIKQLEERTPGITEGESSGYTYIVECGGLYKIGYTTDIPRRLSAFQVANVKPVTLVCFWLTLCPAIIEAELHIHFHHRRVRGEWFSLTRAEVERAKSWARENAVPTYIESDRKHREDNTPRSPYRNT